MATGKVHCKVLFITCHNGGEDAAALRKMINATLEDSEGKEVNDFAQRFTFVIDCAPTMAKVFSASVSTRLVPFG